ncbi:MAG: hypothetical protein IKN41_00905 [Candidatus Methanomethylophilaceae archaeon]|nr:hypothetical protein [Candidatus Methanomethylophilaceae archaeon]
MKIKNGISESTECASGSIDIIFTVAETLIRHLSEKARIILAEVLLIPKDSSKGPPFVLVAGQVHLPPSKFIDRELQDAE